MNHRVHMQCACLLNKSTEVSKVCFHVSLFKLYQYHMWYDYIRGVKLFWPCGSAPQISHMHQSQCTRLLWHGHLIPCTLQSRACARSWQGVHSAWGAHAGPFQHRCCIQCAPMTGLLCCIQPLQHIRSESSHAVCSTHGQSVEDPQDGL